MSDAASLASLSDTLFSLAIVAYSAATIAFAAEFALFRKATPSEHRSEAQRVTPAGASAQPTDRHPAPDVTTLADQPPDHSVSRAGLIAVAVLIVAGFVHGTSILLRGLAAERIPLGNMFELATMVVFVAVVSFLVVAVRQPQLRRIGVFVLVPVTLALFLIGLFLYTESGPLVAALRSKWLLVHVTAVSIGFGGFFTSGVTSALFLVRSRFDERVAARSISLPADAADPGPDGPTWSGFAGRLPSAESLDRASHRLVIFAFPVFTFAVIFGAIWAESAWGRFWGWDPKETWSFIAWIVYAAYLHARATAGWKGRAAAWINVGGLVVMLFNLLYVNLVTAGLHSYAGIN